MLFAARWPEHQITQTRPGSTDEDKITDALGLGIPADVSVAALGFVPAGFAGAAQLKVVTWAGKTTIE